MTNETFPKYKLIFRIYINNNKNWKCCTLILEWQWQSRPLKTILSLFYVLIHFYNILKYLKLLYSLSGSLLKYHPSQEWTIRILSWSLITIIQKNQKRKTNAKALWKSLHTLLLIRINIDDFIYLS